MYRPSEGRWYNRETGVVTTLGQSGDVPLPGDYDGDAINDLAVFRPSTATWIILPSSTGTPQTLTFGVSTDAPVPGDYDGDGKFDLAVYRPSTGIWYLWHSSTNTIVRWALGVGADIPVPADYDGDQIVDVAVYRPSTGMWYIRKSSTGSMTAVTFQWGVAGDSPVPGDYDGDGLSDVAVFRPSTGEWFVRQSSTGTLATRVLRDRVRCPGACGLRRRWPGRSCGLPALDDAHIRGPCRSRPAIRWWATSSMGSPAIFPPTHAAIRNAMCRDRRGAAGLDRGDPGARR